MKGVFLSLSQFQDTTDALDPLSQPSSCMLVNHGPSQQNPKEEYKPWKWGGTARYYASNTKTMLPTRKSLPRSSRQFWRPPDHCKETQTAVVWTCLSFIRSGQIHLTRHSESGKKTRQTSRKTTSGNGQAWSSPSPRGQWRTETCRKLVVKSSVVPQRPSA